MKKKNFLLHSKFKSLILTVMAFLIYGAFVSAQADSLAIDEQNAETGTTVSFTVSVNSAPNSVTSLGLDITYDPAVLNFKGYKKSSLANRFTFFDANEISSGRIRIGGFISGNNIIAAGETGDLVVLTFQVVDCVNSNLQITELKDDVSGWNSKSGLLNCEMNGCPNDPDKTEPGECGCGVPDTDSDGDGTPDCNDECPDDADKTEAGECGCGTADTDSDDDGIPDCSDNCPNDSDKTEPGVCGCGIPDTDSDNDGTPDCNDNCPNDPDKIEPGVCGCGAPDTDVNNDGIPDCNDLCPDDPDKTEPGECGCGTPDIDTDKDGTLDCNDNCPNDPKKTEPGNCGCGAVDVDSDNDGTPDCNDDDADGNGIKDVQEVDDGVDLDNDGVSDNFQDGMKAVRTADGLKQIGLKGDTNVHEVNTLEYISPDTIPDTAGKPYELPFGLIDFKFQVVDSEEMASVVVYFSEAVPAQAKWYKYDSKGWYDYSDHADFSDDRKSVTLTMMDKDIGDDDGEINGFIRDPSGPGYNEKPQPPVDEGNNDSSDDSLNRDDDGGGSGGCFISASFN